MDPMRWNNPPTLSTPISGLLDVGIWDVEQLAQQGIPGIHPFFFVGGGRIGNHNGLPGGQDVDEMEGFCGHVCPKNERQTGNLIYQTVQIFIQIPAIRCPGEGIEFAWAEAQI